MQDGIEMRTGLTGQGACVRFGSYDAEALAAFKGAFPARREEVLARPGA